MSVGCQGALAAGLVGAFLPLLVLLTAVNWIVVGPQGDTCFQESRFLKKATDFSCAEASKNIHTVWLPCRGSDPQR